IGMFTCNFRGETREFKKINILISGLNPGEPLGNYLSFPVNFYPKQETLMACSVSSVSQSSQAPANLGQFICSTTYRYNSRDIPVTVFGRAHNSRTEFTLQSTKTDYPADGTEKKGVKRIEGTFTIVRIWDKFRPNGKKVLHYEGDAINPGDILRNRRL